MSFTGFETYVASQTASSSPAPPSTNSGDSVVPQKRVVIEISSDEEPNPKPRTLEDYWTPTKRKKHSSIETESKSPKPDPKARPFLQNLPILKSSPQKRSNIPGLRVNKSSLKFDQSPRKTSVYQLLANATPKSASTPSLFTSATSSLEATPDSGSKSKAILKPIEVPVFHATAENLRAHFKTNLLRLKGPHVSLVNDYDDLSPPVSFEFINSSIICEGVQMIDEGFMVGCECGDTSGGCKPHKCSCIQQSEISDDDVWRAPYKKREPCLQDHHLATRNHIYECNKKCSCGEDCANKLVQNGRKVPLTIFKTSNRGWGLRCPVALKKGQFIDTYRGEVITSKEADLRGEKFAPGLNYLMDLDHFTLRWITPRDLEGAVSSAKYDEIENLVSSKNWDTETIDGKLHWMNPEWHNRYVCDGQTFGGPTRFMNHSCQPNCRIFTVSYNHADENLYEIAFFALHEITPDTELTFDYHDVDDPQVISDEMADEMERKSGYRPARCLCQSKECRGYFFQ